MLFELNTFLGRVNVLNWVTTVEVSAENIFHSNFVLKNWDSGMLVTAVYLNMAVRRKLLSQL